MVEIAISLAVIAFALVAIIGVLMARGRAGSALFAGDAGVGATGTFQPERILAR
jgi:hypothetical protein